ncbi:MAG: hypothetical protein PHP00_01365 [Thiotrichaceae bacterium]|nr:hypothetical protein [Thiotrichaceae bacterium]
MRKNWQLHNATISKERLIMSSLFEQAYQAWDDGKLEIAFKLFREAAAQGGLHQRVKSLC